MSHAFENSHIVARIASFRFDLASQQQLLQFATINSTFRESVLGVFLPTKLSLLVQPGKSESVDFKKLFFLSQLSNKFLFEKLSSAPKSNKRTRPVAVVSRENADDDQEVSRRRKTVAPKIFAPPAHVIFAATTKKRAAGSSANIDPIYSDQKGANDRIYFDASSGKYWNLSLGQTNIGANNNKFYNLQLIQKENGSFVMFSRWGRVGENGQFSAIGVSDLEEGKKVFCQKFRDKTGNDWTEILQDDSKFQQAPGKYDLV